MFETILTDLSEQALITFGERLGPKLCRGDVVALLGPLGAGKTTLARAAIRAACGVNDVPSPTFSLVEHYDAPFGTITHFDLYRMDKPQDAVELGLEDAMERHACLIEWPQAIEHVLPPSVLIIALTPSGDNRDLTIRAHPDWEDRLADALSAQDI